MSDEGIVECITNGVLIYCDRKQEAGDIQWTPHPKFGGVYLKHLIKGAATEGKVSCHLVRVDPGCMLDEHVHAGEWELHEVIGGEGECSMGFEEVRYRPGCTAVIPQGTRHKVVAGSNGLVLLAKFFPAMI